MANKMKPQLILLLCIALILCISVGLVQRTEKTTDPDDKKFNPYSFHFSDYSRDQYILVLPKILREGMPRDEIDKILIGSAGATTSSITPNLIRYDWKYSWTDWQAMLTPDQGSWLVVLYDDQGKLKSLEIRGVGVTNTKDIAIELKRGGIKYP